jgi:hypothetical protein
LWFWFKIPLYDPRSVVERRSSLIFLSGSDALRRNLFFVLEPMFMPVGLKSSLMNLILNVGGGADLVRYTSEDFNPQCYE